MEYGSSPVDAALHQTLIQLVLAGAARGDRFVVIVDEAHRLEHAATEQFTFRRLQREHWEE